MQNKSKTKLWLERVGVAAITVFALGAPFVVGFVGYLGLKPEGVFINEGDPQRETHIWIERERKGLVGIYVQRTLQKIDVAGNTCIYANLSGIRWNPSWALVAEDGACQV